MREDSPSLLNSLIIQRLYFPVKTYAAGQRFRFIPGAWPAALRKEIVIHLPGQM